jgi:hypothetical protein
MNSHDLTNAASDMMAGGILLMLLTLAISVSFFGFWLVAIVHCIKHRREPDRLMWVLITFLGGPMFGPPLYFFMGRSKPDAKASVVAPVLPPEISSLGGSIDHTGTQDAKERVRAIEEALWNSNRKK